MTKETEIEVCINEAEIIEQQISLEEVLLNTSLSTNNSTDEKFYGNYTCLLIYSDENSEYYVTHPLSNNKIILLTGATVEIDPALNRSDVLVVFDGGDLNKPIVTGIVNKFFKSRNLNPETKETEKTKQETLVFEADKEIVLKCGKSSITLTRAGKILIRGAYLLSRSSGANRIKGGSVHLN